MFHKFLFFDQLDTPFTKKAFNKKKKKKKKKKNRKKKKIIKKKNNKRTQHLHLLLDIMEGNISKV